MLYSMALNEEKLLSGTKVKSVGTTDFRAVLTFCSTSKK